MASSIVALVSTTAGPPFADADADLVLRSPDNVDFHVHKFLLSLASPVFKHILSISSTTICSDANDEPHNAKEFKGGIPVIRVADDSEVLENLLRLVYPTDNSLKLSETTSVHALVQALYKYKMLDLFPETLDSIVLDIARAQPSMAYAIACQCHRFMTANSIAVIMLRQPLLASVFGKEDIECMTTYQYNQLVQYHQRCSTSAVHSARNFIPRNPSSAPANQTPYKANIAAYRDLCTTELKRKPHWDTVLSEDTIIPLIMAGKLDTVETAKYMLHQFGVQLQDEIKLAIQAVLPPFQDVVSSSTFTMETIVSLFADKDADIILRSSDGVNFNVHKWLLSQASPVFRDILSIPSSNVISTSMSMQRNSVELEGGIPIIQMSEDCHVLESLLRLIYPTDDWKCSALQYIHFFFQAVDKYEMLDSFPQSLARILLNTAATHPSTAYSLACHYQMLKTANVIAHMTLRQRFLADEFSKEDMELLPADHYNRLLLYHQQCSTLASEAMQHWWSMSDIPGATERWSSCAHTTREFGDRPHIFRVKNWILTYLNKCENSLRERPHGDTVMARNKILSMFIEASGCWECRGRVDQIPKFVQSVKEHIASVVDKVPPPFPEVETE